MHGSNMLIGVLQRTNCDVCLSGFNLSCFFVYVSTWNGCCSFQLLIAKFGSGPHSADNKYVYISILLYLHMFSCLPRYFVYQSWEVYSFICFSSNHGVWIPIFDFEEVDSPYRLWHSSHNYIVNFYKKFRKMSHRNK